MHLGQQLDLLAAFTTVQGVISDQHLARCCISKRQQALDNVPGTE